MLVTLCILVVALGKAVKLSDRLYEELSKRKGNASFNQYIGFLMVRENMRVERKRPKMMVHVHDYESLGRKGVPDGIVFHRKHRDRSGVPLNEGYEPTLE